MAIIEELVARITDIEQRLDRLADTEIVPFEIGCRLSNSADITTTSGATKDLTFDTEYFDTDNMHSTATNTDRITVNTAGKYIVVGHARWENADNGRRQIAFVLNGVTFLAVQALGAVPSASLFSMQSLSTFYDFSADDYITMQVIQTSGSSLDVLAVGDYSPVFGAWRLA